MQEKNAPTVDQLRSRIDSGQAADKVNFPDPAAAPLGTDAEVGGAPLTAGERAMAGRREDRETVPAAARAEHQTHPPYVTVGFFVMIVAVAAAIIFYASR